MQIRKRLVNGKRRVQGYMVGSQWRSLPEVVDLARQNRIEGVVVKYSLYGTPYVAAKPGYYPLSYLPQTVDNKGKIARRLAR